jgi:hypothetical protein
MIETNEHHVRVNERAVHNDVTREHTKNHWCTTFDAPPTFAFAYASAASLYRPSLSFALPYNACSFGVVILSISGVALWKS